MKNTEPVELIEYKKTPGVCFGNMHKEVKDAVKIALIEEQGYLCCYCGKRIEITDHLKIEHILPQGKFDYAQLLYSNMLLSCDGGEKAREGGNRQFPVHCDSKKKENILAFSPTNSCCDNCFIYSEDGSIDAFPGKNLGVKEIIDTLGLDNPVLRSLRKAAIDAYNCLELTSEEWESELQQLNTKNSDGKYSSFCNVVEYYVKNYKMRAEF
ncbi:retron system putative HNH endonuclease [Fusibacter sp. 3D3]|uniref:retron system putative HNH endonuclease n=1 Tax=Fusibacter sp. 3D3 TaxID=1048380 RepID=UPI0015863D96|nr:retron system putative HNH endonuclease [Fusibacter sp. 3D3]